MGKTLAVVLVGTVLLAGAAIPLATGQGGPPDHANDDGDGPPDHANDDGDGGNDDGEGADETDEEGGVVESVIEDVVGDDDDAGGEGAEADDAGGEGAEADDNGGEGDVTPTATDRATSTEPEASETPTNPVEPVFDIFDTPEETPEPTPEETVEPTPEETQEPTPPETPEGTPEPTVQETPGETDEPTTQEQDPLPDPRETETSTQTETPAQTPEPTESPREDPEETPAPTPTATEASDDDRDDDGDATGESGLATESSPEPTATSTPTQSEPSIEYDESDDATRASVDDVRAGQSVEVPLRGPATDGEVVSVETVDVGDPSGGPFTLTVTRPTTDGGANPAPGVPVGYVDVETDPDVVGNVMLTIGVDEAALPAGVAAGDLEVLRYADGEWESTETTYDEEAGVYLVETAGFSQIAIVAPGAGALQVTDVAVEDESGDGGAATVHATVENTADTQATRTVAITLDGERVGTRELTLGGGETATVTYALSAEQADGETVAVDGVETERLQVQETDQETTAGSIDGSLAFGIGAAAFLVLSAVGTGLLAARSDEFDWER